MSRSPQKSNGKGHAIGLRLPAVAYTKNGVAFRPQDDIWEVTDGPFRLHLNFERLERDFAHMREPLKACLLVFARGNAPHYVQNLFGAFVHFMSTRRDPTPFVSVSAVEASSYGARLGPQEQGRLGTFNVLIQRWFELGLPGVDEEAATYLRERRKPGNPKGAAVRTRDPVNGPLSQAEYTALYKAVDAAYGQCELPQWAAVLTRLLYVCGGRISQYASLKLSDLVERQGAFSIWLPQLKNGAVHSRVEFREFGLSPQTGQFVKQYVDSLLAQGEQLESPMFPEQMVLSSGAETCRPKDDVFFGHCIGSDLSRVISVALRGIAPPTERLNFAPLPISPRRFRYTLGTRMAEEGASKAVIADAFGHSNLESVGVYFEGSPGVLENINKAIDPLLEPLARTFRGRLVEDESHSTHRGEPGSRIYDFRVSTTPLASCAGKAKGCGFNKPVACYTCFKFEPWLDGPHERVLERLELERAKFSDDPRIASINDDAIKAAREVIADCAAVRAQRQRGHLQ